MELNDGQAMSPTPSPHAPALASQPTVSRGASDTAQSGPGYSRTTRASETSQPLKKNGTGHYNYRFKNLVAANIEYTFDMGDELPSAVYGLVKTIQLDRSSPGPTLEDTSGDLDRRIIAVEADEAEVKSFYCTNVFRNPQQEILQKTETHVLEKLAVPGPTQPAVAICTPTPDLIYGYNRRLAFSASQKTQLPENTAANSRGLTLPFLVVEFKGVDGNLWAAENQCLGGSSSCVLIAECFNDELDICTEGSVPKFDTTIFSIAMSGSEARLYVSWKQDDQKYCMALVKAFLLCEPDHYIQFRKHVRNIFDWGLGERLTDIRRCLDSMN